MGQTRITKFFDNIFALIFQAEMIFDIPSIKKSKGFWFFIVLFSTLLLLPPLRFHFIEWRMLGSNPGLLLLCNWQSDALLKNWYYALLLHLQYLYILNSAPLSLQPNILFLFPNGLFSISSAWVAFPCKEILILGVGGGGGGGWIFRVNPGNPWLLATEALLITATSVSRTFFSSFPYRPGSNSYKKCSINYYVQYPSFSLDFLTDVTLVDKKERKLLQVIAFPPLPPPQLCFNLHYFYLPALFV